MTSLTSTSDRVETKRLNEQVRRNKARFPRDFMFQLTLAERSEVVANCDHLQKLAFSHSLPYAFTGHGALMATSILNTERAVEVQAIAGIIAAIRQLMAPPQARKKPPIGFVRPKEK